MPSTMPNTGPPISGATRPKPSAARAIAIDSNRPGMRGWGEGVVIRGAAVAFMTISCNGAIVRRSIHKEKFELLIYVIRSTDDQYQPPPARCVRTDRPPGQRARCRRSAAPHPARREHGAGGDGATARYPSVR